MEARERFILLQAEQLAAFSYMIPRWLLESDAEGMDIQFWGMTAFGTPCGAAVLSVEQDTLLLRYIYILEEFRGTGRGKRFVAELLDHAYREQKARFEVRYIREQYPVMEKILTGYPFTREEEMLGSFSCRLGDLLKLPHLQGGYGSVKALSDCTQESLMIFYKEIEQRGMDLIELPLKKEDYVADCCAVTMENGRPAGLLLVREEKDKTVFIPYILNLSQNIAAPIEMIRFALQMGSRRYQEDTVCRFAVIDATLFQILEKLGITFAQRRQKRTLELAYFAQYEQEAEDYVNSLTLAM